MRDAGEERGDSSEFSGVITGAAKPRNLIGGREGRAEDIYQRDTGHNALCVIG